MNAVLKPEYIKVSEQEYLQFYANHTEQKYELINGYVYAMVGTSRQHNLIAGSLYATIEQNLTKKCTPFMADIKVKAGKNYFYPDIVVDCNESVNSDPYFAERPVLIIEVLSASTRKFDSTQKLDDYKTIATLQEYALIEQDFMQVLIFRKADNWRKAERYGKGDIVKFESIDMTVPIEEIYRRIDFDEGDTL